MERYHSVPGCRAVSAVHYEAARAVGSRSHAILVAGAGGLFEACHAGAAGDVALWAFKVAVAALLTGFVYAIGAALGASVVAWVKNKV